MTAIWESTGNKPAQLDFEHPPYPVLYLWEWFIELHNARQYGMDGAMAIPFTEIESWTRLMGRNPSHEDIKIIKQLDNLAIKKRK